MWPGSAPFAHARCGTHAEGRRVQRARRATTCFQKSTNRTRVTVMPVSVKNNVTVLPTCTLYTQYSPSLRVASTVSALQALRCKRAGGHAHATRRRKEGTPTRQAAGRQLLLYPFMGRPHGHRHQCRCPKHSPAHGCRCEVRFAWPSPHPRWSSHAAAPPQWSEGPPARPRG